MGYEEVFAGHVLPVVRFRRTAPGEYEPVRAVGSGFTFGEGTFITCWHCVSEPLGDGEVYGAAMRSAGITSQSFDQVFELADLEQDASGPRRGTPVIFSYAHHLSALRAARAAATGNLPLSEHLNRG